MILFFCPSCDTRLSASPPNFGLKISCPACDAFINVPELDNNKYVNPEILQKLIESQKKEIANLKLKLKALSEEDQNPDIKSPKFQLLPEENQLDKGFSSGAKDVGQLNSLTGSDQKEHSLSQNPQEGNRDSFDAEGQRSQEEASRLEHERCKAEEEQAQVEAACVEQERRKAEEQQAQEEAARLEQERLSAHRKDIKSYLSNRLENQKKILNSRIKKNSN